MPRHPEDDWRERAACKGLTDIFFPARSMYGSGGSERTDINDYAEAAAICKVCPVIAQCEAWALKDEPRPRMGFAAGMTPRQRRQKARSGAVPSYKGFNRLPAECGTNAAYRRHYREGETPCVECKEAHARYNKELDERHRLIGRQKKRKGGAA